MRKQGKKSSVNRKPMTKGKASKAHTLGTADDYQHVGGTHEDSGGKWRAGDAAKSMRFFQRAIEVYNEGLQKFPYSFDLAFNKARAQLEIATDPILIKQLQKPLLSALEDALVSHRHALNLNGNHADTLYNMSQVITTIAEAVARSDDGDDSEAIQLLKEAFELQRRCLALQDEKYRESIHLQRLAEEQDSLPTAENSSSLEEAQTDSSSQAESEEWVSIVEPVTLDILIDTVLVQLATLTTLCSILSSSPECVETHTFAQLDRESDDVLRRLHSFCKAVPARAQEMGMAKANLLSARAEAAFRCGRIDAAIYGSERDAAFSPGDIGLEGSAEAFIANARSLISFNTALADAPTADPSYAPLRWQALQLSVENLTAASGVPAVNQENIATTHLLRGEASLCMHVMAHHPTSYAPAMEQAAHLAEKAKIYYRNASKLSSDDEEKESASLRSAVASRLEKPGPIDLTALLGGSASRQRWVVEQLEDMVTERLLPEDYQCWATMLA